MFLPESVFALKLKANKRDNYPKISMAAGFASVRKRMKAGGVGKPIRNDSQSHLVRNKTTFAL